MGWKPDTSNVIHDDVAAEVQALTAVAPASTDVLLIEDASDSYNKKQITIADLEGFGGCAELLMQDGVTNPPVPIETEDQTDWLYEECDDDSTSTSTDEDTYWARQAALLDPAAYTWELGSAWSTTVPANEAYYLIGAWNVEDTARFHRRPKPMVLSESTTIASNGNSKAYAYYCDPSAVTTDRAKYFERIMRLEELTQYQMVFSLSSGTVTYQAFPTDFAEGLVIGVSVQDLAWIGLSDDGEDWTLNIWDEISDTHGSRYGGAVMVPFTRATFTKASARRATDHSLSSGTGVITYVKLPSDW